MRTAMQALIVAGAAAAGAASAIFLMGGSRPAKAASADRYQDYILATGAVSLNPKIQTDGVWLLDYKSGKLLGTVIDRSVGKMVGWSEVDLTAEFGLAAKANVHFMMVTGYVTQGQSALYLAENLHGPVRRLHHGSGLERERDRDSTARHHQVPSGRPAGEPPGPAWGTARHESEVNQPFCGAINA